MNKAPRVGTSRCNGRNSFKKSPSVTAARSWTRTVMVNGTEDKWETTGGNYHVTGLPEKAMAPHSSTLAWKIPWTEEPGGPQSMGLLRVGHD